MRKMKKLICAGGLLYFRDSSNLQYVTSASMVLLIYSKLLSEARVDGVRCGSVKVSPSKIRAFAKSQVIINEDKVMVMIYGILINCA